ncbi:MAG: GIY-YIG nuclease family protein [Gaiellales bacterium]|nr:GIY-YIG nuclease family protein [Gaiellales bacterium]
MEPTNEDKKRLKEEFKNRKQTAGVFTITNTTNGRVFLGSCLDADRPLRRIQFELELGSFSFNNPELQEDFMAHGKESFHFEVVETVAESEEKPEEALERLEEKHLARLDRSNTYNRGDRIRFR